jgi:3-methyladenine DNA glycosylase/8-oxoguanine DNA glycosylase
VAPKKAPPRAKPKAKAKPRKAAEPAPVAAATAKRSLYAGGTPLAFDTEAALQHLHANDRVLSRLITQIGEFRLRTEASQHPFQSLVESILHQQVTGKAAAAILGRFRASFGDGGAFPTPERVVAATDEALRAVGVSRSKAAALRDLAAKTLDGTVPDGAALDAMEDEEIIVRLTKVRGIGVWTVHMLLMFRLGRPDVLPVGDYGVRKAFGKVFRSKSELPTPRELTQRAEKWRPYRTVASWYLWRALDAK